MKQLKAGQSVMLSAAVGCGACVACLAGDIVQCRNNMANCYGLSRRLQGCRAEFIRVPAADFNAAPIPDGMTQDQALMLTDNLATAWKGLKDARIVPGDSVVVVGLGPIGLMGVEGAFVMGAGRVFAVDLVPERRARAEALGAKALRPEEAAGVIAETTHGRMANAAFEAVGADATIKVAVSLVGREGRVSVIGVNQNPRFEIDMRLAFFRGLSFVIGNTSAPKYWPELIPLVQAGRLHPERFITHHMPLTEGAEAYRLFDAKEDGALKMVMTA